MKPWFIRFMFVYAIFFVILIGLIEAFGAQPKVDRLEDILSKKNIEAKKAIDSIDLAIKSLNKSNLTRTKYIKSTEVVEKKEIDIKYVDKPVYIDKVCPPAPVCPSIRRRVITHLAAGVLGGLVGSLTKRKTVLRPVVISDPTPGVPTTTTTTVPDRFFCEDENGNRIPCP